MKCRSSENVCFSFCSRKLRKTEKTANTPAINHRYIPKIFCQVNTFSLTNRHMMFYIINLKGYFFMQPYFRKNILNERRFWKQKAVGSENAVSSG